MPDNRPSIPVAIKREVLLESRHHCAVCCNPLPLEQAHIIPWNKVRVHNLTNLIALCANCHSRADNEKWGVKTLQNYKTIPCILARKSNVPDGTDAHLVQLIELLVAKTVAEMLERSGEFASMVAAYTKSPGQVKVESVKPANSCNVVIQLPPTAGQRLIRGFEEKDPMLRSFLDDIDVLSVRSVPESERVATLNAESEISRREHAETRSSVNSTDLTFLTNAPGQTLRDRFGVLLRTDTRYFDCLVGYFFI